MVTTIPIKIENLLINTENFRYEPVNGEPEAISKMLEEQGDKLVNMAQHTLEHGLDPSERIIVYQSSHEQAKYIVLDGNRRVVALKLLNNPDLITDPSFSALRKKFKNLTGNNLEKIDQLECVAYDNPQDAYKWIKLKHVISSKSTKKMRSARECMLNHTRGELQSHYRY